MAQVEWEAYATDVPDVTAADLDLLEATRGVRLPVLYRDLVVSHAGDTPEPGIATVGNAQVPVVTLFFVRRDYRGDDRVYNVWEYLAHLDADAQALGAYLIPFASDSSNGWFVLDYRHSAVPRVSLVDRDHDLADAGEAAIYPVADSFEQFMNTLHD